MGKGLGIAGLVILLLSFPIPIFGTIIGYLALVLVAIAAIFGEKTLVIATTVLAAIKMYMLSPALMGAMYSDTEDAGGVFFTVTFFAALPIIALIFRPAIRGMLSKVGLIKPSALDHAHTDKNKPN